MRRLAISLAAGALAALAACAPSAPGHDKAWYAGHAGELASELAACHGDPGRLGATADCINAQAADADAQPASRVKAPGQL